MSLFSVHRTVMIRNDEVIQGVLWPELDPGGPEVQRMLDAWAGMHFLHQTEHGTEVTLVRRVRPRPPERWALHLLLGVATLFTVTLAGAFFAGARPLELSEVALGPLGIPLPIGIAFGEILPGLALSVPLFLILLGHELGHYVAARRHGMDVSPPYFIPAPPWINFVGTFGAFIRLRSAPVNRAVLLDVGAAGPLVSFALSLPALLLGFWWSEPVALMEEAALAPYVVLLEGHPIWLGDSLVVGWLAALAGLGDLTLVLHPLAFAGWLGLFVTAMNLFPLAQLDGGHILYALVGRGQRWAGLLFLALLVVLGAQWEGWWIWAVLILVLGRGRVAHPPVFDVDYPVSAGRRWVGWACVAIFVLTFVAIPLRV